MGSPLQKVMQEILRVPEMCGDKLAGVQCIMCLCVSTFHAEHFQRKQKKKKLIICKSWSSKQNWALFEKLTAELALFFSSFHLV